MEILLSLAPHLLPLVAGCLSVVLIFATRRLLSYLGVKRSASVDAMIDKYVDVAVDYAEVAGTKYLQMNGHKLPASSKKAKALKVIMDELEQAGITDVARDLIIARLESNLLKKGAKPGVPSDPEVNGGA